MINHFRKTERLLNFPLLHVFIMIFFFGIFFELVYKDLKRVSEKLVMAKSKIFKCEKQLMTGC